MSSVSQKGLDTIRVLHVDDEEDQLILGKVFLAKADQSFEVVYTTSPEKVISILLEQAFDCVVSDYQMPRMNGIELAEKIKKMFRIPFIIYTGRGSEEVAETAFAVGIDDYVRKEFDPSHYQVLAKRIRMAVEKYRAEKELKRREESLAMAQRIAHLGNWDWDIVRNRLFWSDEIYRIFGIEPREFGATYETFLNSVHPDDREYVKKSVEEALHKNKPYSIDHRIVLPNGEVRIVHEQAEVTIDNSSKPIRMIGIVHDITERIQIEERLKKSEAMLKNILEKSPRARAG